MAQCIRHKLFAPVSGDFPVFGVLVIRCTSSGVAALSVRSSAAQIVEVLSDTGAVLQTINLQASESTNTTISQDCTGYEFIDVRFSNSEAVTRLVGMVTSPADASAAYDLLLGDIIDATGITVISGIKNLRIVDVEPNFAHLSTLTPGNNSYIDVSKLGKCVELVTFIATSSLTGCDIFGEVQTMIEQMCANGRNTGTFGTFRMNLTGHRCTWGGAAFAAGLTLSIAFSGTGASVTVTAGSLPAGAKTSYNKSTGVWS